MIGKSAWLASRNQPTQFISIYRILIIAYADAQLEAQAARQRVER